MFTLAHAGHVLQLVVEVKCNAISCMVKQWNDHIMYSCPLTHSLYILLMTVQLVETDASEGTRVMK